jgi:hypothetical protein
MGFVVDKVALGHAFPRVLRFSHVNYIPQVLHYMEKRKRKTRIIFITGLHNKPQGCGASVASAAGPFTITKIKNHAGLRSLLSLPNWRCRDFLRVYLNLVFLFRYLSFCLSFFVSFLITIKKSLFTYGRNKLKY